MNPTSRFEEIIQAALKNEGYDKLPQSRMEYYLIELIKKMEAGGADPETITAAVEKYLREHPVQAYDDTEIKRELSTFKGDYELFAGTLRNVRKQIDFETVTTVSGTIGPTGLWNLSGSKYSSYVVPRQGNYIYIKANEEFASNVSFVSWPDGIPTPSSGESAGTIGNRVQTQIGESQNIPVPDGTTHIVITRRSNSSTNDYTPVSAYLYDMPEELSTLKNEMSALQEALIGAVESATAVNEVIG